MQNDTHGGRALDASRADKGSGVADLRGRHGGCNCGGRPTNHRRNDVNIYSSAPHARRYDRQLPIEDYQVYPARILLAEDDPDLRSLLASELRKDGYIVEEARTGYDLLELLGTLTLRSEVCDLLITDIRMPGLNGLAIAEALRDGITRGTSGTPIILITAFGDDATHAEAERLGATIFDKPFDLDELRSCIRSMINPVSP
jgi:CheY-like chemotaxis protein